MTAAEELTELLERIEREALEANRRLCQPVPITARERDSAKAFREIVRLAGQRYNVTGGKP